MEIQYFEWLSLLFRWLHVIAAVAWIGASFYFVWLDNSLETPPQWKSDMGVKGDLWAFHGGGIYEVAKYRLAPGVMPNKLHWFKWESYATWITGSILLFVIYYVKADLYLVADGNWITTPSSGIAASICFLIAGVIVYEFFFRCFAMKNDVVLLCGIIAYIATACYASVNLFSDRAAFLHVGAMIATIMSANVFLGIIPAQKKFVAAINAGQMPSETMMAKAKLRSFHNNYFTLPVVFCMISNHYSFLYGHEYNWLILIGILGLTAYGRHYFNLKNTGVDKPSILVIAGLLLVILALLVSIEKPKSATVQKTIDAGAVATSPNEIVAEESVSVLMTLTQQHCQGCHSKNPTQAGFSVAPAGIVFDDEASLLKSKEVAITSVKSNYMPLGNMSNMTEEERSAFITELQALQ